VKSALIVDQHCYIKLQNLIKYSMWFIYLQREIKCEEYNTSI